MRRIAGFVAVSALLLTAAQGQDVTLDVSSATIGAGETGQINVVLNGGANEVAGTENELNWNTDELEVSNCAVNEAIDKDLQSTEDAGFFKGIVINFGDLSPIDDGSTLYTCDVAVGAGTAPGDYTISCTAPGASDPNGGTYDTACADSTITVPAEPQVELMLNMINAVPGGTGTLEVSLNLLKDVEVAGTENELTWNTSELSVANCAVNEAIDKDLQSTEDEGFFKGIVINFGNLDPIPDGSLLYSCDVGIPGGTAAATTSGVTGMFEIVCANPGASDSNGNTLETICNNAVVNVAPPPTDTPTMAPTSTATPEVTETTPPTEPTTPPTEPTTPPTQPTTAPPTVDPGGNDADDDSCAIVAPQSSSSGWMLLLPLAGLLWLRRRSR